MGGKFEARRRASLFVTANTHKPLATLAFAKEYVIVEDIVT